MDLGPEKIDCESGHRILLGSYLGDLQVDLLLERPSKKMARGRMVSWVDVFFWASAPHFLHVNVLTKIGVYPPQKKTCTVILDRGRWWLTSGFRGKPMKCNCFAQFPGPQRLGNSLYTITVLHDPCEARAFQGEKCVWTWAKCRFSPQWQLFSERTVGLKHFWIVTFILFVWLMSWETLLGEKSVIKSDLCLRNALKTPFSSSQIWRMSKLRHGQNIVPTADLQDQSSCSMCVVVVSNFAYPSPNHQKWMVMVYKVPYLQFNDVYCTNYCEMPFTSLYVYACIYLPHYNYDYDIWYNIYIYI